jgi:hypothetical protein
MMVFDHQTQARLQEILQRECRSVLSYVGGAFPWTSASSEEALRSLRKLVATEGQAITELGEYLVRRRMPTLVLGSYPSSFTTINFLSLNYLLPRLIEAQRHTVARLETDLPAITDAGARAQLEKVLTVKRRTLEGLEQLASQRLQPAGA